MAGHQVGVDLDHAVADFEAGNVVEQAEIDVLAEGEDDGIGFQRLVFAGRLREALFVELHLLDGDRFVAGLLDRRQPLDHDAFLHRLFDFEVVRGHVIAGAAVDDDRLGAHALGGAGDVDGGVAAAVDHDAATEHRLVFAFHAAQHRDGVDHLGDAAGRDRRAFADVCADGQEGGVEAVGLHRLEDVVDLGVELDRDAQIDDALHFGVEHFARQAVLGNAEAHHAAHQRAGFVHRDAVAEAAQVISRGHARGAGTDDQHVLAAFAARGGVFPAALDGFVAEEAFDRVDADGGVELAAVTGAFAGVVADAAHDRREGVVARQVLPGLLVVTRFGVEQPALDVFTGRALVVAGRQAVAVDRALGTPRTGVVGQRRTGVEGDSKRLVHQFVSVSSSWYLRMFLSARACRRAMVSTAGFLPKRWA